MAIHCSLQPLGGTQVMVEYLTGLRGYVLQLTRVVINGHGVDINAFSSETRDRWVQLIDKEIEDERELYRKFDMMI
jgi:hypothetical protein